MWLNPVLWWQIFRKLQDRSARRVALIAERLSASRSRQMPGSQAATSVVWLEKFTVWVRVASFIAAATTLPLLGVDNLLAMYGVVAAFGVYILCIAYFLIPHRPQWLAQGYLLFTVDSIMVGAAVGLTGGMRSPFAVCYLPLLMVHSLRYGALHVLYAPMLAMVCLAAGVVAAGVTAEQLAGMAFWDFWIVVTALLAAALVERGRRAESGLAMELRRTRALLQAAHAPAASLTVDGVLEATLSQALQLTQADVAAVQLYGGRGQAAIYQEAADSGPGLEAFRNLIRGDFRARQALVSAGRPLAPIELDGARPALRGLESFTTLCAALIPGSKGAHGMVAIARRSDPPLGPVEFEALSAFLERAAMAVQNARLYEQVRSQLQELRALHSSMVRADRLAAIGELAAKVAHELNNPLTSILLYNSLLLEQPATPAEQQEVAEAVVEQVDRAKRVIRNVLDYSRPNEPMVEMVSIEETLEKALKLLSHAAHMGGVEIIKRSSEDVPPVYSDPTHLMQVFINLMLNAIHATAQGGTLTIETGADDEEVYVRFADTGSGISPEDLERIFEPFYSTKHGEEGTGLGLAVSRNLIAQLEGRITVESEVGSGSTFIVWLPLDRREEAIVAR